MQALASKPGANVTHSRASMVAIGGSAVDRTTRKDLRAWQLDLAICKGLTQEHSGLCRVRARTLKPLPWQQLAIMRAALSQYDRSAALPAPMPLVFVGVLTLRDCRAGECLDFATAAAVSASAVHSQLTTRRP